MKLFPSQDDRRAALQRIDIRSGLLRSVLEGVAAVILIGISFLVTPFIRSHTGSAGFLFGHPFLFAFLMIGILTPLYYRARVRRALRSELVRIGVPICVNCAYHLQGLQAISKCPECGALIEPRVRSILNAMGSKYRVVAHSTDRYNAATNLSVSKPADTQERPHSPPPS